MLISALTFYFFAATAIFAGAMVIFARNPVHSVLFLILAFFSGAGLFLLAGAEFLAMMLVVVYVGAVAVLFLFVVMMLDINFAELRQGFVRYLPIGAMVGVLLITEIIVALASWRGGDLAAPQSPTPPVAQVGNTHALGQILYTDYLYLFQGAGVVLLVAMIGAIVLTHRQRSDVRRQKIAAQVARRKEESVAIVKVQSGSGI
ncbi:MAG TPA: NADH-quinone oxidoreductase subunit J [Dongiaceae bacterium]|jgi:NADH-quinone oxidoreductase subunit J|nr:NADH-quinone oxidoreductase subunit J [Dongiaceae bacterium]